MVDAQRIMIVEDESLVAEDLQTCLSGFGYQIVGIADTYEDALDLAERGLPDLALLDIRIKGRRDGIALAETLRERGIGFVYLTSYADRTTLDRAEVTEPLGYLMKPFDRRELLPTLKMAFYRHRGESRLRNMEHWLTTTLRSIGDGVAVTDAEGRITYLNPAAEAITGRSVRAAIGNPLMQVLQLVDARTGFHLECVAERAMRENAVVELDGDVDLVQPDGRVVAIEDCSAPVRDDDGSIQGAVVVFKDASDKKRLERERREAALRMERAERLESLGVIAGGLAHDFNNVLTVIAGNVELCRAADSSELGRRLDDIERGVGVASSICRQLLEGAGAAPLRREDLPLADVLAECLTQTPCVHAPGVRLVDDLAGAQLTVFADPLQFRQVLINFLNNACEAISPAGGTIVVRGERREVSEGDAFAVCIDGPLEPGSYVWVEVHDDGAGIDERVLAHLFQPFFTTKSTGRGLGLSSVRGIVRRHGGGVAVESRPGAGTTFRTWWPVRRERAEAPRGAADERPALDLAELLVVDDDPSVRGVTCRLLEDRGVTCHAFGYGPQALAALESLRGVDAALIDMRMPGMSGPKLLAEIRRRFPTLPVVLMTGYTDEEADALRDSCTEVLLKPFTSTSLWAALSAVRGRESSS